MKQLSRLFSISRDLVASIAYGQLKKWALGNRRVAIGMTSVLLLGLSLAVHYPGRAATATLVPDGDIVAQWAVPVGGSATCTGGVHCDHIDEGVTATDGDYVSTGIDGIGGEIETFSLQDVPNVNAATQAVVNVRLRSITLGSTADTVLVELLVSGSVISSTTLTMTTTITDYTLTANGTWSQAEVNSMQVRLTRTMVGGGKVSDRDDNVALYNAYTTLTYTERPSLEQSTFRWYENQDTSGTSIDVGAPLAALNTPAASPVPTEMIRLRMGVHVSVVSLGPGGMSFKLQYAPKGGSATCALVPEGDYRDVTEKSDIRYANNTGAKNGLLLTASANDPSHTGHTTTRQAYYEVGTTTFSATSAISVGEDALWDFALSTTMHAHNSSSYCLRIVGSDGSTLDTYSQYPELTVRPTNVLGQKDFRFYDNANSAVPGLPLAPINAGATLGGSGANFRLRGTLSVAFAFKTVDSGTNHTCAITSDEQAYCWGSRNQGALGDGGSLGNAIRPFDPVSTNGALAGKTLRAISTGGSHTCAIASDDQAYCWGDNDQGKLGNGITGTDSNVPVAVSTTGVLAGKTIKSISAGWSHTCAIASDDQAYCWGDNDQGGFGNNDVTGTDSNVPVAVSTTGVLAGKTIKSISAGWSHTCAIASDDQAYCWGDNDQGKLGIGITGPDSFIPVAVSTTGVLAGKTIKSISVGAFASCVTASDDLAYCWGGNGSGQLGNGNTGTDSNVPVAVSTSGALSGKTVSAISAGGEHACAVASDGLAYCWGKNNLGQQGGGDTTASNVPVAVSTSGVLKGKAIKAIPTGDSYTCAIASDNQAYCWGGNGSAQLGYGNIGTASNVPVAVLTKPLVEGTKITSISAGYRHTCALASSGQPYCWGDNSVGELGNGTTGTNSNVPTAVVMTGALNGKTVTALSSWRGSSCAIASDALPYCWGANYAGQLGNGNTGTDSNVPVAVSTSGALAGKTVKAISVGYHNACVIASDDQAYCWGDNQYGQLGNGNTGTDSNVPVAVSTSGALAGKTILSIDLGVSNACVIASDYKAYCWGYNGYGTKGDGTGGLGTESNVPVAVSTSGVLSGKSLVAIDTQDVHTCAVSSDGLAYCWGDNYNGTLGDGTYTDSYVPVAVSTDGPLAGKNVVSVSLGKYTLALTSDGDAYYWGAGAAYSSFPEILPKNGSMYGKDFKAISSGTHADCAIASDDQLYCRGDNTYGNIGNGTNTPSTVFMTTNRLWPVGVSVQKESLLLKLQFAQKNQVICSAVTSYVDITTATALAYADNPGVANASSISTITDDPVLAADGVPQRYYETGVLSLSNSQAMSAAKYGLWDFSLKDNGAPANTTYCLRLANTNGSIPIYSYSYFPEITTSASGSIPLDQQVRGGQSVVGGTKNPFSW